VTLGSRLRPRPRFLRRAVGRAVGWIVEVAGGPPPGYAGGPLVDSVGRAELDGRPVVVVLLLGSDEAVAARTAEDLAAAVVAGAPRVLVVLDTPHFAVVRRVGLPVDHLLSPDDWSARGQAEPWSAHVAQELARLRRDLGELRVLRLPPDGAAGRSELIDLLGPPGPRPRGWRRAGRRWAARLDRVR
jgi:hypothetical protein